VILQISDCSNNDALRALPLLATREQSCSSGILEDFTNTFARLGGALKIVPRANLLSYCHTLIRSNGSLLRFPQLLDRLTIAPKILLATNEDDRETGAEMHDFGNPLLLHIIKGVGAVDGKADQDDVRVRVREWAESIVIFLAGRIP